MNEKPGIDWPKTRWTITGFAVGVAFYASVVYLIQKFF